MEKKYKISEFANILGITPKTVYRMIEREEIVTVSEKVNNRSTTIVVISDDDLEKLKENYSKSNVNVGNYYENVTDNNDTVTNNECSQSNNYNEVTVDLVESLMELNKGYNEQLNKVNDQLIKAYEDLATHKSQSLLLTTTQKREEALEKEINELKRDINSDKTVIEELKIRNDRLKTFIIFVIIMSLTVIGFIITVNNIKNTKSDATVSKLEKVEPTIEKTSTVQPAPAPIKKNK